ncbi:MAG: PatB family C-S lyase [Pseudomonadales bacterium]|nr:PatB family C-S lyase [Pseudomonadales bacterium]
MLEFASAEEQLSTQSTRFLKYAGQDILPMWVADMDVRSPASVQAAVTARLQQGVYGYTKPSQALTELIVQRSADCYDWHISAEHIHFMSGVVAALNMACRGLLAPDEAAVTATPVYYPFLDAPGNQQRELRTFPVVQTEEGFRIPLDTLDEHCRGKAKLLMLCNPFNPLGRHLTRSELEGIVEVARRNDMIICSDEIHCDLLLDGQRHIPTATVSDWAAANTVTLMAPSKTFNLAGFGGSLAIAQNPDLLEAFKAGGKGIHPNISFLSLTAMEAAYRDDSGWLPALLNHLSANRDFLMQELNALRGVRVHPVEATYLAWIEVQGLGLNDAPAYFESYGLGMSPGGQFGDDGFMRLNFGCSRAVLEQAVDRFKTAVSARWR